MLHMAKCLLLSITPSHFLHKQILPRSLSAIYSYLVYVMHLEDIGRFWLRTRAFQSLLPALTTPLKEFLSFFFITHRMKIILVTALGPVSKLNEKVPHHANTLQRRIQNNNLKMNILEFRAKVKMSQISHYTYFMLCIR